MALATHAVCKASSIDPKTELNEAQVIERLAESGRFFAEASSSFARAGNVQWSKLALACAEYVSKGDVKYEKVPYSFLDGLEEVDGEYHCAYGAQPRPELEVCLSNSAITEGKY